VHTRRIMIGVALATSVALAACSKAPSAVTTSPKPKALGATEWVAQLCAFGSTLNDQIQQATSDLQNASPATLQESKQLFVSYFDTTISTFQQIDGELAKLGTPAVDGGAAAVVKVTSQFDDALAALEKARTEAEALPTDDATTFSKAAEAIGNELRNTSIGENGHLTFGQSDLDTAYQANATCQALENSPSP